MKRTPSAQRKTSRHPIAVDNANVVAAPGDVAARLDDAREHVIQLASAHVFPLEVLLVRGQPRIRLSDFEDYLRLPLSEEKQPDPPQKLTKVEITGRWFQAEIRESIFRSEAHRAVHSLIQFAWDIRHDPLRATDMDAIIAAAQADATAIHSRARIDSILSPPAIVDAPPKPVTERRAKKTNVTQ